MKSCIKKLTIAHLIQILSDSFNKQKSDCNYMKKLTVE